MPSQTDLSKRLLGYIDPFQNTKNTKIIRYPILGRFVLTHTPDDLEIPDEYKNWTFDNEVKYLVRDLPVTAHYLSKHKEHSVVQSVEQALIGYRKGLQRRQRSTPFKDKITMNWDFYHLDIIAKSLLDARIKVFYENSDLPLAKYSISYRFKYKSMLLPLFRNYEERNIHEDREINYGVSRYLHKFDKY
jgi:hypothetical protein